MEETTTPSSNTPEHLLDARGGRNSRVAKSLLRMALVLLDRDRQHSAAANVASALDDLGEPPPDLEKLMTWLDECDGRAARRFPAQ